MKKLLALSLAACVFSFAASAQTERATTAPSSEKQARHGKHGDKDKMMKELNLTTEQKAQLKAQHKEMKAKRDALKGQDNITVKEMREKQAALKAEQKSKMDAVLTPEQKTKMAELKKQKGDKMKERKNKARTDNASK